LADAPGWVKLSEHSSGKFCFLLVEKGSFTRVAAGVAKRRMRATLARGA
jgi:hypothetical protein